MTELHLSTSLPVSHHLATCSNATPCNPSIDWNIDRFSSNNISPGNCSLLQVHQANNGLIWQSSAPTNLQLQVESSTCARHQCCSTQLDNLRGVCEASVHHTYQPLKDYHRLYNMPATPVLQALSSVRQSPEGKTTMAVFLDQIDASSSLLSSARQIDFTATGQSSSGPSSQKGAGSSCPHEYCMSSGAPADPPAHPSRQLVRTPTEATSLSTPSPLRTSRSFTTSYRQRPNVTLIRRKSASERLAESKSKYIRAHVDSNENTNKINSVLDPNMEFVSMDDHGVLLDYEQHHQGIVTSHTRAQLRTTPTSTRSSHTSSSHSPGLGFSPISDANCAQYNQRTNKLTTVHNPSTNLMNRINSELNKAKPHTMVQHNCNNSLKKRISPRLSDTSALNSTSNLEIQLRELISLDPNTDFDSLQPSTTNLNKTEPIDIPTYAKKDDDQLQKEREANDIYRAEFKYIGSSVSSSSSVYSEPNDVAVVSQRRDSPINFASPQNDICNPRCSVLPSGDSRISPVATANAVIRSKSDASVAKQMNAKHRTRGKDDIERFLESLGLDSDSYKQVDDEATTDEHQRKSTSQSSNLLNCTGSSFSNDSLEKIRNKCRQSIQTKKNSRDKVKVELVEKSASSNDVSSLNSSHISLSDVFHKNNLNHSKSTSKLTFENLMLHQQNLTPSRSCNNLAISFYNGPSVVERNARIIKWLFNCRKAMSHSVRESDFH